MLKRKFTPETSSAGTNQQDWTDKTDDGLQVINEIGLIKLMMVYKYSEETYRIIKAAFEVYNTLGFGFKEEVYQEAMERECTKQGVPFERQKLINLYYKGEKMDKYYQADLLCYGKIIVELKAVSDITGEHTEQLLNYLKATGIEVGLVLNFGSPTGLQKERKANFFGTQYDTTRFESTIKQST